MRKMLLLITIMFLTFAVNIFGQTTERYTGTIVSFGSGLSTRSVTRTFDLTITGQTSDNKALGFLEILQSSGQDLLLKEISKEKLGRFSFTGNLARDINVVRESVSDGKRRIFIVFERWLQFAEIRGGYRSVDYPFSVIEMFVDEKTGKGEGTFIPAARISWRVDKKTQQNQVEIENFATFPAKIIGVTLRSS